MVPAEPLHAGARFDSPVCRRLAFASLRLSRRWSAARPPTPPKTTSTSSTSKTTTHKEHR